jgi:RNA polymerase sigma factor (sigma-70 family)
MPVLDKPMRLRDDAALVAAFRDGRDEAFTAMHDRHRPSLERYARRMLAASGDAAVEDVVQDVFVRAHRALRADGRAMALRPWLYRIAHNRCLDELRSDRPTSELDERLPGGGDDPHALAAQRERLRDVVADVRALPATQRSALVIRELGGLSYEEMADALDTTVPAVKSLLVRARMKLADAATERAAAEQERDRPRAGARTAARARPALA